MTTLPPRDSAPSRQEFFYNKPLGVSLCLRAFVAIFISARASNAEVDYVISHHGQVIPIEVKSGFKGQMQSLYLFLEEKKLPLGLRVSSENFGAYDRIKTLPLYAVPRIYH